MKKEYIIPEFEIYQIKMESCLMAGSVEAPVYSGDTEEESQSNGDAL